MAQWQYQPLRGIWTDCDAELAAVCCDMGYTVRLIGAGE